MRSSYATDTARNHKKMMYGVEVVCKLLKREIANGNKTVKEGFDYAKKLAKYEPWAARLNFAHAETADLAACFKSTMLSGEAHKNINRELGIVDPRYTTDRKSLYHRAAETSTAIWPALVVIEWIALSLGQRGKARTEKLSLIRGMAVLIQRGANTKCIARFARNMTYGFISLDLAGNAEKKKQTLASLAGTNDAGVESIMKRCLVGFMDSCLSACGPRKTK